MSWFLSSATPVGGDVGVKLKACGEALTVWSRESFGNVNTQLKRLRDKLQELEHVPQSEQVIAEIKKIQWEPDELLKREEV
jgi:hypothetical protein